ncbi:MAG: hypothetical protein IPH31_05440 [Lewinellaceae bacterium]|nr:hypothetical protein [Lewinellaceae bacterium]
MYHTTERNERQAKGTLVLAIALHLALVAMLYFKMTSESVTPPRRTTHKGERRKRTAYRKGKDSSTALSPV